MTRAVIPSSSSASAAFSAGCTHSVHQLSVGGLDDIPRGARLLPIQAETDQEAFLAAGDTDFADQALAALAQKCPRGRVVGIEARYSTSLSFLSYTNRMTRVYSRRSPASRSVSFGKAEFTSAWKYTNR